MIFRGFSFVDTLRTLTVNLFRLFIVHLHRDQLTTTEVNMARVYNWDVKRRQAANSGKK